MSKLTQLFILGLSTLAIAIASLFIADKLVKKSTEQDVFSSTQTIPHNKVGLLLGTGKQLKNGFINPYYQYRINAAQELFLAKKIDVILVSGDNSSKSYDEPSTIKEDLIKKGIPADNIVLDYAGFRTLDSIVRAKKVFGQETITIISQQFHNERAIYIAKHKGVKAVGYNAQDVEIKPLRERFARVKMFLDLLFGKQPKFLGEKISIS